MVASQQLCHCDSVVEMPALGAEGQQLARMEAAVQQLLVGVGEDPSREGLVDTPRRVAKAWLDMTRGYRQECKSAFGTALFHEPIVSAGPEGLVIVRDITFAALSEATLLPFHGRCHIAYVPAAGVVLGLSKLARVTKCLAARLQTQQQFTERLVAAVQGEVAAAGVAAVVQAAHLGAGPAPAPHTSSAATGCFTDPEAGHLAEFLTLLRLGGHAAAPCAGGEPAAAATLEAAPAACVGLAEAAGTLLRCVGEDPTRKGLRGGAARYAAWLQGATAGYRMTLPSLAAAPPAAPASAPAADLGPPTPDEQSPDPSDASSDDMSADPPCHLAPCDAGGACCVGGHSRQPHLLLQAQRQQRQRGGLALAGLQTFEVPFASQCEHHLLPFYGSLRLAFLPASGDRELCGGCARAALAHVVQMFSRRLQVQERLTHQVADAVCAALGARAVLVVVESAHMCMVARGVEKHASTTLTTAARGAWAADASQRAAALEALLDARPHPHLR